MVNLLIGTNTQTGGYAADFAGIQWTADAKFLVVDLDIKGTCNNFEELSNQPFTYVPFAYYSPASDVPGNLAITKWPCRPVHRVKAQRKVTQGIMD